MLVASIDEPDSLIGRLVAQGVNLSVDRGDLVYGGSDDVLGPDMIAALRRTKNAIVSRLELNRERGVLRLAPTTREQQRMEWRSRTDRHAATYNVCIRIDITGPLTSHDVEHAARTLVQRHEIFRTRFASYGEHLVQEIMSSPRVVVQVLERAALDGADGEQLLRWCARRGQAAFDLASEPPSRWCYAPVADGKAVLLLTMHHIACDGWSIGRLIEEFQAVGNRESLPAILYTPADFADYERQWLTADRIETARSFWAESLCNTSLSPRFRRCNRAITVGGEAGRVTCRFPLRIGECVAEMARTLALTEFSLYLAAFTLLLREETDAESCAVVIAVANRTRPEHEEMMGLARNAQAIPCSAGASDSLQAVARRISAFVQRCLAFPWFPINFLPSRPTDGVDTRCLPITFAFEHSTTKLGQFSGCEATVRYVFTRAARGGLSLQVRRQGPETDVLLEFATDHFTAEDATEMARRYVSIVVAALTEGTTSYDPELRRSAGHDSHKTTR